MVFLGSVFVGLSLYLNNLLHGGLPPALANMGKHAFLIYSILLLILSVILAMRIIKLHGGMTINGVFYSKIILEHGDSKADPIKASYLNWSGVSTGLFLLTAVDAALAAMLCALAIKLVWISAAITSVGVGLILLGLFLRNHHGSRTFALEYISNAVIEPVHSEEIEDHLAHSLQDANQDMIGITGFVGLILFSVMENLSGLGDISGYKYDIAASQITSHGPLVYSTLALITAVVGTITYRRLAVAAGELSLKLDSTDNPFSPMRLTDTALGYLMLCVLYGISLHLLVYTIIGAGNIVWSLEVLLNFVMLALYPIRMWQAQRRSHGIR
ncbi:hypothetical protein TI04_07990 [Achromatium sp. WMS2]|nr:hypothetical protein TI04_07990 [Achromatium sp. WMS2]